MAVYKRRGEPGEHLNKDAKRGHDAAFSHTLNSAGKKTDADADTGAAANRRASLRAVSPSARRSRLRAKSMSARSKRALAASLAVCAALAITVGTVYCAYSRQLRASLPETAAQQIAAAYNSRDVDALLPLCGNLPGALSRDPGAFAQYLEDGLGETRVASGAPQGSPDGGFACELSANGKAVATLKLELSEPGGLFRLREARAVSIAQHPLSSLALTAPSGAEIFIGGEALDLAGGSEGYPSCFSRVSDTPPERTAYSVADLCRYETVSAVFLGRECAVTASESGIEISLVPEGERAGELTLFCEAAAGEYARLLHIKGASPDALRALCAREAPLLERISEADNSGGIVCERARFESLSMSGARQYSESEYSCNVSLELAALDESGGEAGREAFSCEVFAVYTGEGFFAVDIEIA